jgi:hypothetical protein
MEGEFERKWGHRMQSHMLWCAGEVSLEMSQNARRRTLEVLRSPGQD